MSAYEVDWAGRLIVDARTVGMIAALNTRLNKDIDYSDDIVRGKVDDLRVPVGVKMTDDCDGYAWRKMYELQELVGLPPECLRPVLCYVPVSGEPIFENEVNHCVLAVVTISEDGQRTYILDNMRGSVLQWPEIKDVRWVMRLEPDGWRYVKREDVAFEQR